VRLDAYREREFDAAAKVLTPRSQSHYRAVARRLRALRPAGGAQRLFDFGCGAGGFLVEARAAGFAASGLELNRDLARHVATGHGIPVHCGEITDLPATTEPFDVVTSFQVFEHLLDPRGTLRQLTAHLAPRGLLFIEVPNLHDVRERLHRGRTMDDSHLFYFHPRSLGRLLDTAGLRVVEVHEGLRPQRLLGDAAARLPSGLYRLLERTTAVLQLKTVLGVVATRR
jgi:2-polyprenyl-3-methyl-5-hydroxy-6-metoxy-1,4-benzoquinol methylase